MEKLKVSLRRLLFLGALILAAVAAFEKLATLIGYTLLRGHYSPGRLLEYSAVALLFVIALQLREIETSLTTKS